MFNTVCKIFQMEIRIKFKVHRSFVTYGANRLVRLAVLIVIAFPIDRHNSIVQIIEAKSVSG